MSTPAVIVADSPDLRIETNPTNPKNLTCLGCMLDPDWRNMSFSKVKLGRHLALHAAKGHKLPAVAA